MRRQHMDLDERGRDVLGFIEERCPHCNARYYLADESNSKPICLNACTMPTYLYRKMQQGLAEAKRRTEREEAV
jgi:hypothetical protein